MGRRSVELNIDRVKELYEKYGTLSRTALSLDCSPDRLKKFLVENNIPIKPYIPKRIDLNRVNKREKRW